MCKIDDSFNLYPSCKELIFSVENNRLILLVALKDGVEMSAGTRFMCEINASSNLSMALFNKIYSQKTVLFSTIGPERV